MPPAVRNVSEDARPNPIAVPKNLWDSQVHLDVVQIGRTFRNMLLLLTKKLEVYSSIGEEMKPHLQKRQPKT